MAIALDSYNSVQTAIASSLTYSATVGAIANGILVVGVEYYNWALSVSSLTFNGVSLTKAIRTNNGSLNAATEIWYLVNPPSGAHSVVVTLTGSTQLCSSAASFSGVHQTTPMDTTALGNVVGSGSGSLSQSITTVTAGAWLVDVVNGSWGSLTANSPQVSLAWMTGTDAKNFGMSYQGPVSSPGNRADGWTGGSTSAAATISVAALRPAGSSFNPAWARGCNQIIGGGYVS